MTGTAVELVLGNSLITPEDGQRGVGDVAQDDVGVTAYPVSSADESPSAICL